MRIGKAKATVLPLPVSAMPMISCTWRAIGIDCSWIGVLPWTRSELIKGAPRIRMPYGVLYPSLSHASTRESTIPYGAHQYLHMDVFTHLAVHTKSRNDFEGPDAASGWAASSFSGVRLMTAGSLNLRLFIAEASSSVIWRFLTDAILSCRCRGKTGLPTRDCKKEEIGQEVQSGPGQNQ